MGKEDILELVATELEGLWALIQVRKTKLTQNKEAQTALYDVQLKIKDILKKIGK